MNKHLLLIIAVAGLLLGACSGPPEPTDVDANTAATESSGEVAPASAEAAAAGAATGELCDEAAARICDSAADFCKKAIGVCEATDIAGSCTTKPEICTMDYTPVCGCNEQTYSNACAADAAGVNIAHAGECGKEG